MGFFAKLGDKLDRLLETDEEHFQREIKEKGDNFEKYIKSLFPPNFTIEKWTTDIINKTDGTFVEANLDPDFTIRDELTKQRFAIECKYRSKVGRYKNTDEALIRWSNDIQIQRYKNFEKRNKIPVFIMIGVGGKASEPEYLFCVPLNEIKYPTLLERTFAKYERIPDKELFFKNDLIL